MRTILIGADDYVGEWALAQMGSLWTPGRGRCFGAQQDGKLVAGVVFDSCNGASVNMHVAALPGRNWLSKGLLGIVFDYPFNQLGVAKILSPIGEGNLTSRRFCEHIGFKLEATLSKAHPDGSLLLYSLEREACRWLKLAEKEPWHEQTRRPRSP